MLYEVITDMLEAQRRHCVGDVLGLVRVELVGETGRNVAEGAGPGAVV